MKYLNQVVYIDSPSFKNRHNKSPYVLIYKIKQKENELTEISMIDIKGRQDIHTVNKFWMNAIKDFNPPEYMRKDFIKIIFKELK